MKKIINTFIFCAVAHIALSQQSRSIGLNQNDPNYPAKGRFNAGILTTYSGKTPPPVLFGNITYGISNKFSQPVGIGHKAKCRSPAKKFIQDGIQNAECLLSGAERKIPF